MIKVLHFVTKMDRAGQETFLMNVYRNIDRTKIQFVFLCSNSEEGDYDDEIYRLGGEIYVLPEIKKQGKVSKYLDKIRVLSNWLRENKNKFDIVHLHTYHSLDVWVHLEACRRAQIKKRIVHSHNTCGERVVLHKIFKQVCKMYKFEKFACSKAAGEWLFDKKAIHEKRVTIIYNGIDFAKYYYDTAKAKEYRQSIGKGEQILLGHVGRFNYQKNHDFLIEVFAEFKKKHSNSALLLIGRGELENKIKEKVKAYGLEDDVKFLGVRDDIPDLLNIMDVFVFPSHFEGLSVVMIEAQAAKLPIVASDFLTDEVVIDDAIRFLSIGDISQWVEEIEKMCQINRTDISFNENKENFDIRKISKILEKKYNELVNIN